MKKTILLLALFCIVPSAILAQTHHTINVEIDPSKAWISGWDEITLIPQDRSKPIRLLLARQLEVTEVTSASGIKWRAEDNPNPEWFFAEPDSDEAQFVERAQAIILEPKKKRWPKRGFSFRVEYEGVIYDSLRAPSRSYSKGFATTTGLIDTAGVFLGGGTLWIPMLMDDLFTFDLETRMPAGWETVSQGERTVLASNRQWAATKWHCPHPMEECYLVAAKFHVETRTFGDVEAMTYLRQADTELSDKYLSATGRYLSMYEELIGPYPFRKFALVENFWQTGYGMPSFTLLGSQVIRFPWIVHTSYGHEILHNWWGNGVFVDWDSGNWCEGITVYGADYLYKEMSGEDAARQYRLETLASYMNYVKEKHEISLAEFHERHSASTQAIGYGKAMMLFHMLRRRLGDDGFWESLRTFYETNLFRIASWDDVQAAFEKTSGLDLDDYFDIWVRRSGAPSLSIEEASLVPSDGGYRFEGVIRQSMPTHPLSVPVRLQRADRETTWTVELSGERTPLRAEVPSWLVSPQRTALNLNLFDDRTPDTLHVDMDTPCFSVDPDFDVFRLIQRDEVPAILGELLGADTTLVVLPRGAEDTYRGFADQWAERGQTSVVDESALPGTTPSPGALMFFEWVDDIPGISRTETHWEIQDQLIERPNRTLVFTIRDSEDPDMNYTWVLTDDPSALGPMVRKLPHYGKYSYVVFSNEGGRAIEKGTWRVYDSPMSVELSIKD